MQSLGRVKNTAHNAEYSASGSVADKGGKDTNYNYTSNELKKIAYKYFLNLIWI